jgi:hypothetical protein
VFIKRQERNSSHPLIVPISGLDHFLADACNLAGFLVQLEGPTAIVLVGLLYFLIIKKMFYSFGWVEDLKTIWRLLVKLTYCIDLWVISETQFWWH